MAASHLPHTSNNSRPQHQGPLRKAGHLTDTKLIYLVSRTRCAMAEQQQNNPLAALFPSPPQFFESFTAENLNRIEDIRKAEAGQSSYSNEQGSADKGSTGYQLPVRIFDLPTELRFLQPPPPPADGKYRSFGDVYDVSTLIMCDYKTLIIDSCPKLYLH